MTDSLNFPWALVGKEVCATLRRFTIQIFGLYVEKHDLSKYFKFQDNRINSLEVMAFLYLKSKRKKPTFFFSIFCLNLPPIKIFKVFLKKVMIQDFGSRQIKEFPIDCTQLFF